MKRELSRWQPIRSPRSDGQAAGLSSVPNMGRTSVNHSSRMSEVQSHTVSTLRRLGGEPFLALPNRTWQRPNSPNSAPCGLRPKSAASSILVSLRRKAVGVRGLEQGGVAERGQPALAAEGPDPGNLVVAVRKESVQLGLGERALLRVRLVVLDVHRGVPLVHDLDGVGPEPLLAGRRPLIDWVGDKVTESAHSLGVGADRRALQIAQRA